MSGDEPASEVVLEARAARQAGRLWQARDLLTAHVEEDRDAPALRELADVLTEMGDLPRAGAIWFATGAQGPDVDAAVAAWREQTHDDFAAMWRSLPASVRAEPRPRRVEALRERALKVEAARAAETTWQCGGSRWGRAPRPSRPEPAPNPTLSPGRSSPAP